MKSKITDQVFSGAVASIDGTYVVLQRAPSLDIETDTYYVKRKGFFALQATVIADINRKVC